MFAFMEAADESKRLGGQPVKLADIIARAEAEANRQASRPRETAVDVVVYGGTSAGIIAAIQAERMGKSVVLIEPSNHLGGLTTGGLGATDIGNKAGHRRHGSRFLSPHLAALSERRRLDARNARRDTTPATRATIPTTTRCGRSSRTSRRRSIARCWTRPAITPS